MADPLTILREATRQLSERDRDILRLALTAFSRDRRRNTQARERAAELSTGVSTAGVAPSDAPNTEVLQWAVKTLRFLLLKRGGEPVGPHAEFERAVTALGVKTPLEGRDG